MKLYELNTPTLFYQQNSAIFQSITNTDDSLSITKEAYN